MIDALAIAASPRLGLTYQDADEIGGHLHRAIGAVAWELGWRSETATDVRGWWEANGRPYALGQLLDAADTLRRINRQWLALGAEFVGTVGSPVTGAERGD